MIFTLLLLLAAEPALPPAAPGDLPDDLPDDLTQALSTPPTPPVKTYEVAYQAGDTQMHLRLDMSQPAGERLTLLSPNTDALSKDLQHSFESLKEEVDGNIWCDQIGALLTPPVAVAEAGELTQVYRFKPAISEEADRTERAFAKASLGHIHIGRTDPVAPWQVNTVQLALQKPFKPMPMAKITELTMTIDCAPGPDGRMYKAQNATVVRGSALGQAFEQTQNIKISNVAVRPQP